MDELAEHEAFLRAIFAAPDEDTPRLVYADYLDEHAAPYRAEFIRVQCELVRANLTLVRRNELEARAADLAGRLRLPPAPKCRRGFARSDVVSISPDDLARPVELRRRVVTDHPEWYGATALAIEPGRALFPEEIPILFDLPFTQQVTEWNLGGHTEELAAGPQTEDAGTFGLIDMNEQPVITVEGVEVLTRLRGARRIHTLILTQNNLDNDAARAIVRSPYFINLKRLDLLTGNRLRGQTWQQLRERFGEDVVG